MNINFDSSLKKTTLNFARHTFNSFNLRWTMLCQLLRTCEDNIIYVDCQLQIILILHSNISHKTNKNGEI